MQRYIHTEQNVFFVPIRGFCFLYDECDSYVSRMIAPFSSPLGDFVFYMIEINGVKWYRTTEFSSPLGAFIFHMFVEKIFVQRLNKQGFRPRLGILFFI